MSDRTRRFLEVSGPFPPKGTKRHKGAGSVTIENPELFHEVFARVLAAARRKLGRRAGMATSSGTLRGRPRLPASNEAVARYLGLSRETVRRLANGTATKMHFATFRRLLQVAGREGTHLESAVLSTRSLDRLAVANERFHEAPTDPEASMGLSLDDRERLLKVMKTHSHLRHAVRDLNRVLTQHGHTLLRRIDAFRQAISPLYRYFTTFGVERGIDSLTKAELGDFVAWGLRREIILLRREADVSKAQKPIADCEEGPFDLGSIDSIYSWDFLEGERRWRTTQLERDFSIQAPRSERDKSRGRGRRA